MFVTYTQIDFALTHRSTAARARVWSNEINCPSPEFKVYSQYLSTGSHSPQSPQCNDVTGSTDSSVIRELRCRGPYRYLLTSQIVPRFSVAAPRQFPRRDRVSTIYTVNAFKFCTSYIDCKSAFERAQLHDHIVSSRDPYACILWREHYILIIE